ncbi:phosphatidylinositol alpha-1,6-mannosyltransferase [Arcanobacterium pluranimalium]|uniref:glycosyltransferase family 4 protein n=1 Tax=Arcanobacterium pluranimalium TaxID=108028 RepID=UPI00195EE7D7|nr:glycosyltransferase family 4 protein [Arcanobacterium pluranimalium]MBM7825205.1 phosphatidylinositol alpha-1,6-mannosyltransferase [Arcanobacterium pluranimalium]
MKKTLLVTNDFPPRAGGIQTFLEGFVGELDPAQLVVYASTPPDTESESGAEAAARYDASVPYTVVRYPGTMMLPIPAVQKKMQELIVEHEVHNVWFGAAAPLGLMANAARKAGAQQVISTTHGHEIGWSMIPGARALLRKVFHDADVVTYLTQATLKRLRPCIGDTQIMQLHGAINPEAFAFDSDAKERLRNRYGIAQDARVVVCISRLVERKGQDKLILAWERIVQRFPGTKLLIVGKGPYGEKLQALAAESKACADIIFTGEVPYAELAAHYSVGDVFAMPCRTRGGGLDIEGLGIVYLEAYAAGLPVVAGDSGGAPEAVIDGKTGLVVNGNEVDAIAQALEYLLDDPQRAEAMGAAGHAWVDQHWRWSDVARPLVQLLS